MLMTGMGNQTMKKKIKVHDFNGKLHVLEKEVRAQDHLAAQQKFKAVIFCDKTKFSRHPKYRKPISFDEQQKNFSKERKIFLTKRKKFAII